jgi:lambda family phage portal protein
MWHVGGLDAGRLDRNTEDWNPGTIGPNRLHQLHGRTTRERVRNLELNNPFAVSGINAFVRNVVGTGITPKARFADPELRSQWEDEFEDWAGVVPGSTFECDLEGRRTLYELQAQILREVLVGGGCLVHFVERPIGPQRRHPVALELIPEERIAEEQDTYALPANRLGSPTNRVVRGVEIDAVTGAHVAYWVKPTAVNDVTPETLAPVRIPADRCRYVTLLTLTNQVRGFSVLAPVVLWLHALGVYVDNEMVASKLKSAWAYFVKTNDENVANIDSFAEDPGAALTDTAGNAIERVSPGAIMRGRPGDEISAVGPNVPQADSVPWLTLIQQSIAMGLDLSEIELTRDYSRVNFSSARAAANRDRKTYRYLQQWLVNHLLNEVWFRFVRGAVGVGLTGFPTASEFLRDRRQWLRMTWRCPGWATVNPVDDAQAQRIQLQDGTLTREQVVAERGDDWEEVAAQWELENAQLGFAGEPPDTLTAPPSAAPRVVSTPDTPAAAPDRRRSA